MKGIYKNIAHIWGYIKSNQLESIYYFGVLLRLVVFVFQGSCNGDEHYGVVKYVHDFLAIPVAGTMEQADHPPLYYVLASFFAPGGEKIVQLFSLLTSILTLSVIYWLIENLEFIQPLKVKKYCLLLVCTLPQFVMFGNYISNDSLAFFMGSLIFLQIYRYINKPDRSNQNLLAVFLGLGLLTKGSFLSLVPGLLFLVIFVNYRQKMNLKRNFISVSVFILIFLGLGSFKGIQNTIYLGYPVAFNVDLRPQQWMVYQQPAYVGLKSLYDVNIFKLFKYPAVSNFTHQSYPLMLYGSFWYEFWIQSDFRGNLTNLRYLGSAIYFFALLPTLSIFIGFSRIVFSIKDLLRTDQSVTLSNRAIFEITSLFLLLSQVLMIFYVGAKHDIWSWYQARYVFPSFFAIIVLFNSGIDYLNRYTVARKVVYPMLICLFLLFMLYFCSEIIYKTICLHKLLPF